MGTQETAAEAPTPSPMAETIPTVSDAREGWQMAPTTGLDDAEARSLATYWLGLLHDVQAVRGREAAELKATKARLDMKAAALRERRNRDEAVALSTLVVLFEQIELESHLKSVALLGGTVGTRITGESINITDQTKLFGWLRRENLYNQIVTTQTIYVTDTKLLKTELRRRHDARERALKETGEVIELLSPGVDYTPKAPKFYATPDSD